MELKFPFELTASLRWCPWTNSSTCLLPHSAMTVFQFPDYQYLMCFFHIWQILLFSTSHLMTPPYLVLLAAGGLWEKREVAQLYPTLCNPIDCSLPGSLVYGIFQAIVLEWVLEYWRRKCHFLLQGIFSTQGSNPGLPHCRQMLYHLSHQGMAFESSPYK